ncbi:MAG: carbohydrate-binding domain-containing protein [Clostridia bacterium]|nr:carbohydrate-binding domain-containing protein [Clostridia bacterium]
MNAKFKFSSFSVCLILFIFTLFFVSCGVNQQETNAPTSVDTSFSSCDAEMFTQRDLSQDYDPENAIFIELNGSSATSSSSKATIDGTTIKIADDGVYIISGTLYDGMIIVDAASDDKPQLVLNGASIFSSASAPIYIKEANKVFITLAKDTQNTLCSGEEFISIDESNIDSTIFSRQDLTLNGQGSLTINSPAGHGVVCKDDLVISSGTYKITSAYHGIDSNDSIRIANASLDVTAGKDGLHTENSDDSTRGFFYISSGKITISSNGDGISSSYFSQIKNGDISITTSSSGADTDSFKGIKASGVVLFEAGNIKISSADDAIHSNDSICINGGNFDISTGDDGMHADNTLSILSGNIDITKSYEGLEALTISISGGKISIVASDDGLNAAGGTDSSGFAGMKTKMPPSRPGEQFGGGAGSSASNGLIEITGGNLYIKASGDGIDSNGSISIKGGSITVCGPTNGDTAVLDYDNSGTISGGTFIGTGAYMMAQSLEGDEQGVIGVQVGNQSAGTEITVTDSKGNIIISYTPQLSFQIFIFSSPELNKGESYTISVGTISGTIQAS